MLFDHLTQKKGMSVEEALDVISEEFVNYNKLPGRGRDYLESIGLLWFYNYKLRATKVALRTARSRPLTTLLMAGGIEPSFGIDTVFSSSLPGKWLGGRSVETSLAVLWQGLGTPQGPWGTLGLCWCLGTESGKEIGFSPANGSSEAAFPGQTRLQSLKTGNFPQLQWTPVNCSGGNIRIQIAVPGSGSGSVWPISRRCRSDVQERPRQVLPKVGCHV